jgi:hypothetical protein
VDAGNALYSFIPDAGATVVFIVFMWLWHKRTMARDSMFHETMQGMMHALMECVKEKVKEQP